MPVASELKGGLLHLTLTGEQTFDEIALSLESGLAAAGRGRTRVLLDASQGTRAPDVRRVERLIALLDRCRARLGRVAIVGCSSLMFGISRQIAQTIDSDDTPVQAFWNVAAAGTWLHRRDSGAHLPA